MSSPYKYTKQEIIDMLQSFYKEHGRSPIRREITICSNTAARQFGCWSNALIAAGLPTYVKHRGYVLITCEQCGKQKQKPVGGVVKTKHNFCSHHCAKIYQNAHKTTGIRRSKLEVWIEEQIHSTYPNLPLICNDHSAINAELDFYFPTLQFAIELNGIVHYEPIYGPEKLASVQTNDDRKFQSCLEHSIELCIVDVSKITNDFSPKTSQKYWQPLKEILDKKLVAPERLGLSTFAV